MLSKTFSGGFTGNRLLSGFCAAITLLLNVVMCRGENAISIRVMSANLTSGNYQRYEAPGIRLFQGLKPDVVAIQEFNYASTNGLGTDTPAAFREMLDTAFGTNFNYYRQSGYSIPNGIISRFPILDSGSWTDAKVNDRAFAWARLDLPGTNDLYVVSVHLYSSGSASDRNDEALALKSLIQSNFPADAWVIVAGDFNTTSRTEFALATFGTFLSDSPIPTDNNTPPDPDTNEPRNKPYDYVLPGFSLTNYLAPVTFTSESFSNGLVFDSAVFSPLSDVAPILPGDSHAPNMQHMAVIKDFVIPVLGTVSNQEPVIVEQPRSATVPWSGAGSFSVRAYGSEPLAYQWRFNGTNLARENFDTLILTNVQDADAGDYRVVITNSFGSATSEIAKLIVDDKPVILSPPSNLVVNEGDDARFSVAATGPGSLRYQWLFGESKISGATNSEFIRTNAQAADAGPYSVLVSNDFGAVTSAVAVLTVNSGLTGIIAQWDFNSPAPDDDATTGTILPSLGNGTASLVGGTTATFATGDSSLDPAGSIDNSGWNSANYPAQGTGNKTAGVQFDVSTAGRENISVSWSQRNSNTGSKYARLQYTTNGASFADYPEPTIVAAAGTYQQYTLSLARISGVADNPNFAFRVVSEFESTATRTGSAAYAPTTDGKTYGSAGTLRFDMVTVSGDAIPPAQPPAPAVISGTTLLSPGVFQMNVAGTAGSNYVVQVTDSLTEPNWIPIFTNAAPFAFTDTNVSASPEHFYRVTASP